MFTHAEDEKKPVFLESFEAFYREKKYPQAFIVASKYPQLKESIEYIKMQEHFHALLKRAAFYVKKGETQKAKEIIGEYARVEDKRVVVKLLLTFGEEFLRFLKAVKEEDLEWVFKAVKRHREFAAVPSFLLLKTKMLNWLEMLEMQMDAMELEESFSVLWLWEPFLPETKELQKKLHSLQKLQMHYEEEEWDACYTLIEEDPLVKNSLLAQLLHKHWYKSLEKAKMYAQEGEMEAVYRVLKQFVAIKSKHEQIKRVLFGAAKREIAMSIENGAFARAEKLLFEAADHFGKKSELLELAEIYYKKSGVRVVFR